MHKREISSRKAPGSDQSTPHNTHLDYLQEKTDRIGKEAVTGKSTFFPPEQMRRLDTYINTDAYKKMVAIHIESRNKGSVTARLQEVKFWFTARSATRYEVFKR